MKKYYSGQKSKSNHQFKRQKKKSIDDHSQRRINPEANQNSDGDQRMIRFGSKLIPNDSSNSTVFDKSADHSIDPFLNADGRKKPQEKKPTPKVNTITKEEKRQRVRREIPPLQRYDSKSMGEEELNDYFNDPQKRMQYDLKQLEDQMARMQYSAGFQMTLYQNRDVLGSLMMQQEEEKEDLIPDKNKKVLATNSLCCLTLTNPFRSKVIAFTINEWFDRFILIIILANCAFLAMENEVEFVTQNQRYIDETFLYIYSMEMILKIIAMGFFTVQHSYLRDPWNILDFVVVIMGWISHVANDSNISVIRTMRILRPLRTINSMPGMSSLVTTIIISLPSILDIMILFLFMIIMFGTMATQLLMGHLRFRCQIVDSLEGELIPDPNFVLIDDSGEEVYCPTMTDAQCHQFQPEGILTRCAELGNPWRGTFNFDNLLFSALNLFEVITLEGWTDMMYIVRQAERSYGFDALFILVMFFGVFFVLNLMIAVQFKFLNQAFLEEAKEKELLRIKMEKLKQEKEDKEDSFFGDDDNKIELNDTGSNNEFKMSDSFQDSNNYDTMSDLSNQQSKYKCFCCRKPKKLIQISAKVEEIVEDTSFQRFILFCIVLNTCFLSLEHYDQPVYIGTISELANTVFTVIFTAEMLFKLLGLGCYNYFTDGYNMFDCFIVILSDIELMMPGEEGSGVSVFRAFRLLRIFKLVKSWTSLRSLLQTILRSIGAISNLGLLTFLFLFINSLMAKQLFLFPLYQVDGTESRYNFERSSTSFLTTFICLTGENWNEIMIQVIDATKSYNSALFFVQLMLVGHFMLLNLYLAIMFKYISNVENMYKQIGEQLQAQLKDEEEKKKTETKTNLFQRPQQRSIQYEGGSKSKKSKKLKSRSTKLNNSNYESSYLTPDQIKEKSPTPSRELKLSSNEHAKEQKQQPEKKLKKKKSKSKLKSKEREKENEIEQKLHLKESSNSLSASYRKKKEMKKQKIIEIDFMSRSCGIFASDNTLRLNLKALIQNPYFDNFIYHMIALNSILLILDEPSLEDKYQKHTINILLKFISTTFIIECIMKIIVMGFVSGKKAYLQDGWNILDFIIVICSVLTWILELTTDQNLAFVRGFRALRALRPLRVISRSEGIKTIVNALLQSIPNLLNVLLIIALFMLVFGILGVQIFKGQLGYCNDTDQSINFKKECIGNFTLYNETIARKWIVNENNYDNVFESMLTFFEISTLEMWTGMMYAAIDSVGIDHVPLKNNRPQVALIYIFFIFLTSFFIMNLFISVIVEKFNVEIKKRQGEINFTIEQREWVKINRLLLTIQPKVIPVEPINSFRLWCFNMVQSSSFEYFIMVSIMINTACLCVDSYGQSIDITIALEQANDAFVIVFTIEAVLKIIAYGWEYYWHVNWNKFDIIIVVISLFAMEESLLSGLNFDVTALRIIRVTRLLKMVKTSKGLRSLLTTLYRALANIFTTASLLVLILFTYTVAGMNLFSNLEDGEFINKNTNFRTFYIAITSLWRASTGESWNGIMHECYNQNGMVAYFYWISFVILCFFIFLNVFVAVIYESFKNIQASEDEEDTENLRKKDLKAFQNTWAKLNPRGNHFMRTIRLSDFLRELPPPLGYQGIQIDEVRINKIINGLNIRDYQGKVYYPEIMWSLFHSLMGINDEAVSKCEQISLILKVAKRQYKHLPRRLTLDYLCGCRYTSQMTAQKYLMGIRILSRWRLTKQRRLENSERINHSKLQGLKLISGTNSVSMLESKDENSISASSLSEDSSLSSENQDKKQKIRQQLKMNLNLKQGSNNLNPLQIKKKYPSTLTEEESNESDSEMSSETDDEKNSSIQSPMKKKKSSTFNLLNRRSSEYFMEYLENIKQEIQQDQNHQKSNSNQDMMDIINKEINEIKSRKSTQKRGDNQKNSGNNGYHKALSQCDKESNDNFTFEQSRNQISNKNSSSQSKQILSSSKESSSVNDSKRQSRSSANFGVQKSRQTDHSKKSSQQRSKTNSKGDSSFSAKRDVSDTDSYKHNQIFQEAITEKSADNFSNYSESMMGRSDLNREIENMRKASQKQKQKNFRSTSTPGIQESDYENLAAFLEKNPQFKNNFKFQ